jgi:Protein of unknown function (DUF3108)
VLRPKPSLALLLCLVGLATGPLARADQLKPFEATFTWAWHGLTVAVSTLKLEQHDDVWVYTSKSEPRGIGKVFSERPTQESTLRVTDGEVRPLHYKADDGTPSTKRDADVVFDWEHNHATGVYEDEKVDMPIQPGLQDDLSVQVALVVELLAGHQPERFRLIDKNTVREYHYTREGQESVATPFGNVDTIVFASQKAGSPRLTRFWCAPSLGYIPVRVEQTKGNDVQWTMQAQSIKRD